MRINVQNMLRQAGNAIPARIDSGAYRFALTQLAEHLLQLRDRTQAGDLTALDEFFRLYVFDGQQQDYTRAAQGAKPVEGYDANGSPVVETSTP